MNMMAFPLHYGDLKPGDLVDGSSRGMMVLSAIQIDTMIKVTWIKLWGYDGVLFSDGLISKTRVYVTSDDTPHDWKLTRPGQA